MEFQRLLYQSLLCRSLYFLSILALNILIAQHYEPAGSGKLFYTLNNYAFVLLILSVSIDSGMGYYLASGKIAAGKLFTLSIGWVFASILICLSLSFLYLPDWAELQTASFQIISLFYIGGVLLVSFFSALFFARKDFFTPNLLLVIINLLIIFLLVLVNRNLFSWLNSQTFLYIYIGSFLAQGLALAFFFIQKFRDARKLEMPSGPEMKMLLRYSLLAFTGNVLTFLVFRLDYWLIDYFNRPVEELGNYIQVSKLAQLFFTFPSILASAVFPFAAGGILRINEDLKILSRVIFLFALIACIFLAMTGQWLFPLVFGEKFNMMYLPFLLLIPGIIAICLAYPLASYFSGKDKIRTNIYSSILALVVIVVANFVLIPLYGIRGAAVASSLGYSTLFIYLLIEFKKESPGKLSEFLLFQKEDFSWLKASFKKNPS